MEKKNKPKKKTSQKDKPPRSSSTTTSEPLSDDGPTDDKKRSGMLLVDASVAPADIKYPTDLDLLNSSREHSETIIDELWQQVKTTGEVKLFSGTSLFYLSSEKV